GRAVATIVPEEGGEEAIVAHMLGEAAAQAEVEAAARDAGAVQPKRPARDRAGEAPALEVVDLSGAGFRGISFALAPGEVLGIAALEGQGQDQLFDVLAGSSRPEGGEIRVARRPFKARHPYDAVRASVVLVPADRLHALLPQRSVRENIAS